MERYEWWLSNDDNKGNSNIDQQQLSDEVRLEPLELNDEEGEVVVLMVEPNIQMTFPARTAKGTKVCLNSFLFLTVQYLSQKLRI